MADFVAVGCGYQATAQMVSWMGCKCSQRACVNGMRALVSRDPAAALAWFTQRYRPRQRAEVAGEAVVLDDGDSMIVLSRSARGYVDIAVRTDNLRKLCGLMANLTFIEDQLRATWQRYTLNDEECTLLEANAACYAKWWLQRDLLHSANMEADTPAAVFHDMMVDKGDLAAAGAALLVSKFWR